MPCRLRPGQIATTARGRPAPGTIAWAVAALLAVLLAGVTGWLVRGGSREIVYVPFATSATSRIVTPAGSRSSVGGVPVDTASSPTASSPVPSAGDTVAAPTPATGHPTVSGPAPKDKSPIIAGRKHKSLLAPDQAARSGRPRAALGGTIPLPCGHWSRLAVAVRRCRVTPVRSAGEIGRNPCGRP